MPLIRTIGELKKVESPPRLWRQVDLLNEEPQFVTLLVNRRSSPVQVEEYGRTMFFLQPGKDCSIESWSPLTTYSRYSRIVFEQDGQVSAKENPDWRCPYEGWAIDLINGQDIPQSVRVTIPIGIVVFGIVNDFVSVPPGLARLIPLDIHDPLVKFKSVEWRLVKEKLPVVGFPNYMEERETMKKIMIPRAEREVDKIRKQLENEKLEAERIRAERRRP
jgi:hypothetical protein